MSDDPTPWDNATESATVSGATLPVPACSCLPLPTLPSSGSRGRVGMRAREVWGLGGCCGAGVCARVGTAAATQPCCRLPCSASPGGG